LDTGLFEWINGWAGHAHLLDSLVLGISRYGPYVFVALFVIMWLWPGPRERRDRWQWAAIVAAGGALLALGTNQVIVHIWARPRPFVFHPAHVLGTRSTDPSFPSDHAAFAFAAASGLCFADRRAGILGLALALLIAFSRVFVGEHYVSDVAAGALIGVAATLLVNSQKKPLRHLLEPLLRVARRIHLA